MELHWSFQALIDSLPISGKGMLGIFVVTAAIILTVALLTRLSRSNNKS